MRTKNKLTLLMTLALSCVAQADLKVHEWGTFTSLVGSNGVPQHGMYHEDERLPDFVHDFGAQFTLRDAESSRPTPAPEPTPVPRKPCNFKFCVGDEDFYARNLISQKMETPVLYFYTDQPTVIDVNVRFPKGIITQTFPAPYRTSPTEQTLEKLENGNTSFRVLAGDSNFSPPSVEPGNIYGHARQVASSPLVSMTNSSTAASRRESEKFIFYRGLGQFDPKIEIRSRGGSLSIQGSRSYPMQAAFLVYVSPEGGQNIKTLGAGSQLSNLSEEELDKFKMETDGKHGFRGPYARNLLIEGLVKAGLFKDEAIAMVNTWEHGYLNVPGLRFLYILPESEVAEILPLTVSPRPSELRRAFVGRIEILTEKEENQILSQILRDRESFNVQALGRFAEPKLQRISEIQSQRDPLNFRDSALLANLLQRAVKGEGGVLN